MSHNSVTISLTAIAALVIGVTVFFSQSHTVTSAAQTDHSYDAFVDQLHQTQFNKLGKRDSVFISPNIKHLALSGHSLITHPHIIMHNKKGVWDVTADHAHTLDNNDEIRLTGHVKIIQPATKTAPQTVITTHSATVYPKRSYATTKDYVTISRANTMIAGQGATADMKQGVIKLLAHTRGHYVPTQHT